MVEGALLVAASLSALCGMGWLALAMKPHWEQLRGATALGVAARRRLRALGSVALGASLLLCLLADHASMAVLVWMMSLTGAALAVAFTLAYRPSWLRWLIAWSR